MHSLLTKMGGIISSFLSPDSLRSASNYVRGEAKYIWGLKANLGDLETEKENLIATKEWLLNNNLEPDGRSG